MVLLDQLVGQSRRKTTLLLVSRVRAVKLMSLFADGFPSRLHHHYSNDEPNLIISHHISSLADFYARPIKTLQAKKLHQPRVDVIFVHSIQFNFSWSGCGYCSIDIIDWGFASHQFETNWNWIITKSTTRRYRRYYLIFGRIKSVKVFNNNNCRTRKYH